MDFNHENIDCEFLSFINKFLKVIFKLSLVNFKRKNSIFTIDQTLEKIFEDNKNINNQQFYNLIFDLLSEINSTEDYFDAGNKIDFDKKDINFEILKKSVNFCYSYCLQNINYKTLVNNLIELFQSLINDKNILTNKESKNIIIDFSNFLTLSINYTNKIKSFITKDDNYDENNKLKKELKNLNDLINNMKLNYEKKEKECLKAKKEKEEVILKMENLKQQKEKLDYTLNEEKIQNQLDKNTYENIMSDFQKELKEIKKKQELMEKEIIDLKKQIIDLKKENKLIKKKQKIYDENYIILFNDINFLVNFAKDFNKQLDDVLAYSDEFISNLKGNDALLNIIKDIL